MLILMINNYKLLLVDSFLFNFSIKPNYHLINSNHFQRSLNRKSVLWLLIFYFGLNHKLRTWHRMVGGEGVLGHMAIFRWLDSALKLTPFFFFFIESIFRMRLNYLIFIKNYYKIKIQTICFTVIAQLSHIIAIWQKQLFAFH